MNLYDLVKRRDPALETVRGSLETCHRANDYVGVRLASGTEARVRGTDRFETVREGNGLGWRVLNGDVEVIVDHGNSHDLILRSGTGGVLRTGAWFSSGDQLLPFAIGSGIEVGPGDNPKVRPSSAVEVSYLEDVDKELWRQRYNYEASEAFDAMWSLYEVGDAHTLDVMAEESLDFIFSSHVFEHLTNPLGVLANWSRRLKPGGSVLAVIPNSRYSFDLRQTPSTPEQWMEEQRRGGWTASLAAYEKWFAGTILGKNTPENLMRRGYSVHAHYYTPRTFDRLADMMVRDGGFSYVSIVSSSNAMDFVVRLVR